MGGIHDIEITNFKSIRHLKIEGCNRINVFVGVPNAGKSNVLEAIGLYGGLDYSSRKAHDFVRYGDNHQLYFNGNTEERIQIGINKSLELNILSRKDSLEENFCETEDKLRFIFKNEEGVIGFTSNIGFVKIKKYIFKTIYNQVIGDISLDFPFGENIGQIISQNSVLRKEIVEYLKENGLKVVIKQGNYEFLIQRDLENETVFQLPYSMIADTLQRLFFYKAAILSNKESVLLFEEPEAHCFEPYILDFTNDVKYDKNNNQYFIVTHSDYIVKEFLRDEESKADTNIYLVNNVDGETQVKLLRKENNDDVYEFGMNVFFNFESLWRTN